MPWPVSNSIAVSANPICFQVPASFHATGTNVGTAPHFKWYLNGVTVGVDDSIFIYTPQNGDVVTCQLTSSEPCATNNPAMSNTIVMTVISSLLTPVAGTSTAAQYQVTWNWNAVPDAAGYKWNVTNNFATATDMGTATSKTETALTCNTAYSRYVWAYNSCGQSSPVMLTKSRFPDSVE